jgi:hypothetical protein
VPVNLLFSPSAYFERGNFTPIRHSIQAMRNASREMEPSLGI